jgi:hypothetical protein
VPHQSGCIAYSSTRTNVSGYNAGTTIWRVAALATGRRTGRLGGLGKMDDSGGGARIRVRFGGGEPTPVPHLRSKRCARKWQVARQFTRHAHAFRYRLALQSRRRHCYGQTAIASAY